MRTSAPSGGVASPDSTRSSVSTEMPGAAAQILEGELAHLARLADPLSEARLLLPKPLPAWSSAWARRSSR